MANTQHTLQLRAQLDTTQVRQELQKLRQQYQPAITGSHAAPGSNSSVSTASNSSNLVNLNNVFTRLTSSIQHLDTSIQKLNSMNSQAMNRGNQSGSFGMPLSFAFGQSQKDIKHVVDMLKTHGASLRDAYRTIASQINAPVKFNNGHILQDFGLTGLNGQRLPAFNLTPEAAAKTMMIQDTLRQAFPGVSQFTPQHIAVFDQMARLQQQQIPKYDNRILKFAAGMALNQIGGSAADYLEASGNDSAAAGIRGVSKVTSYTASGAAIGGLYGAGAGAVLGAVELLFDTIAAKARETQERIGREWDVEHKLGAGTDEWKKSLTDYRKSKRFTDLIDQFGENYQTRPLEAEYGRLATRKDFVQERLDVYQKMSEQGFLGEADLKAANDLKNELSDLDNKMKTITNTLKNFRKTFEKTIEADEYSRKTMQMFKTGSLLDIQGELTTLREFRDKAKAAGNIEDFTKYSSRIRQLEQREELIQETQRSSALELGRMDESYQNSRILERYGIDGGRGVRSTMMDYAKAAVSERSRYERLMSEGRLEEAAKAKASWKFAAGERNTLADQLLQVLGSRTADLTNVTSLASIGANMGEVNSNFDRQMAIWEDQRNLQRDIKNILNEREFVAHYGE